MDKFITVFTPAYNRRNTIGKLYDSLCKQEFHDFEWLIVDDGSKDGTRELINSFINENKITIRYFYQPNQGKHVAINRGVKEASGLLFLIVDSDDFLTDNALAIISQRYNSSGITKEFFAGIAGTRITSDEKLIGSTFSDGEYVDATSLERYKYNLYGDKAEVFFTDVLRRFEFPIFEGERFVTEALVWNRIARNGLKIRWFNDPLIVCEYRNDGLTKNIKTVEAKNPQGYLVYFKELIESDTSFIRKVAHIGSYCRIARNIYSKKEICEKLEISGLTFDICYTVSKVRSAMR